MPRFVGDRVLAGNSGGSFAVLVFYESSERSFGLH